MLRRTLVSWLQRFDGGRFIAAELMVLVGFICCLAKVQNDTWWHLAAGRRMAETGRILLTEEFSHTAYGAHWANYEWLSEVVFYQVYLVGGLPLLVILCALSLMGTCLLMWKLIEGRLEDRILIFALALPLITPGWVVRPQAFSLLLLMVVVHLVVRERFWWLPPVFLLWADLHGGVALGLVVLAGDLLAAATSGRDAVKRRVLPAVLSFGATLLTPLGLTYWPEVLRSLRRSQVNQIAEWQPPGLSVNYALFWIGAAVLIWLVAARWRHLNSPSDRTLAAVSVLMLVLAVRSMRNVGSFALLAAPALSRAAWADSRNRQATLQPPGRVAPLIRAVLFFLSVVVVLSLVWWRLIAGPRPGDWTPVSAPAAAAIRQCRSPIYNHYNDGGYLIWFVPEQRVFLDSRQDPYPVELVQAQLRAERTGEYRELFERYAIACAVLRPDSAGSTALSRAGWTQAYRDAQWVVIESPRDGMSGRQGMTRRGHD
jgi:hypothetical protein